MSNNRFLLPIIAVFFTASIALASEGKLSRSETRAKKANSLICEASYSPKSFLWQEENVSIEEAWIEDVRLFVLSFRYIVHDTKSIIDIPEFKVRNKDIELSIDKQRFCKEGVEGVVHLEPVVKRRKITVLAGPTEINFDLTALKDGKWEPRIIKKMQKEGRFVR